MDIQDLRHSFHHEIKGVKDAKTLEGFRIKYLGRKDGELTKILRSLKDLPLAKKRKIGPAANNLRKEIEVALEAKLKELQTTNYKLELMLLCPAKRFRSGIFTR